MAECLPNTKPQPITGYHGGPRCQFTLLSSFHSVCWFWQLEFPSQSKGLFNWICSWWQNCCFAERRGVLWLSVYHAAMGKGEENDSQWLLISSICSALGPLYLQKKKQHVERKWQAETHSLAPSFSPRSVFKQGGPITLSAPDRPPSIITLNPYSSIK